MGAWAPGLYSDDFALDLRALIASLARLPFSGDEILAELRRMEPAADDTQDESHTVFWLVAADQFVNRGIACDAAMSRAQSIMESGQDLSLMRELGMSPRDLRVREKKLADLASAWQRPAPLPKIRRTLSKPQSFLLDVGSVWCYPTCKMEPRNPYFTSAEAEGFNQDGWGAMIVLARDRAFGWLAWYAVAPIRVPGREKPLLQDVFRAHYLAWRGSIDPKQQAAIKKGRAPAPIDGGIGALSATHFNRMQFEKLGNVKVQPDWWQSRLVNAPWSRQLGASGISIANHLLLSRDARESCLVAESLYT